MAGCVDPVCTGWGSREEGDVAALFPMQFDALSVVLRRVPSAARLPAKGNASREQTAGRGRTS